MSNQPLPEFDPAAENPGQQLDGRWEYACIANPPYPFDDGEWARGGTMLITTRPGPQGTVIDVKGIRLWTSSSRQNEEAGKMLLPSPRSWSAVGVGLGQELLTFTYKTTYAYGHGESVDSFFLPPDGLQPLLSDFVSYDGQGNQIMGPVRMRKMRDVGDLRWCPPGASIIAGIDTPVSQVFNIIGPGSVAIGNNAHAMAIVTQGLQSQQHLVMSLQSLGVPDEEIQRIQEIVQSEEPGATNLGKRAAHWVGQMVGKGLSGAWEVGKDVSSKVLAEALLNYYGLK